MLPVDGARFGLCYPFQESAAWQSKIKTRSLPSTRHGATAAGHETAPFHNPVGGFPDDVRIEDGCIWPGETPGLGLEHKPHLAPIFADMLN